MPDLPISGLPSKPILKLDDWIAVEDVFGTYKAPIQQFFNLLTQNLKITGISGCPLEGSPSALIEIQGVNFLPSLTVTIQGITVLNFVVVSETKLDVTIDLTGVAQGTYNLTVTNPTGQSDTVTFEVFGITNEPITFTDFNETFVQGNELVKENPSTIGFTGAATSTKGIKVGDGYLEFNIPLMSGYAFVGLSHNPSASVGINYIDFAFYVFNDSISIYEGGISMGGLFSGVLTTTSILRVSIAGSTVNYILDGTTLLTTNPAIINYPLYFDCSIFNPGKSIKDCRLNGILV